MVRVNVLSLALTTSLLYTAVAAVDPILLSPLISTLLPPSARTSTFPDLPSPSRVEGNVELRALPRQPELAKVTTLAVFPRDDAPDPSKLLGYTYTFGTYSPWHCHSGTYLAVSGYARCCEKDVDCPVFTACENTSVMKNDKYRMTCNGTASQSVCVTGTIFESIGDLNPRLYINCWSNWTDGDWKATRTTSLNATVSGIPHGGTSLGKGPLAGIILGALIGLALLVAFGVFAARVYSRMRRTLGVLEERAKNSSQDDSSGGEEEGVVGGVAPLEGVVVHSPPPVHLPLSGPSEVSAERQYLHEMEQRRPGSARTATDTVFVDAPEYH